MRTCKDDLRADHLPESFTAIAEACDFPKGNHLRAAEYRVPAEAKLPKQGLSPDSLEALRKRKEHLAWCVFMLRNTHIDPHKVGVLGFSAGGL